MPWLGASLDAPAASRGPGRHRTRRRETATVRLPFPLLLLQNGPLSSALLPRSPMPDMRDAIGVLLAGGQGERLWPLTRDRAKPAVPFGALYRIIDITLSN